MLSPFEMVMLVFFLASAWVSRRHWRGLLWLGVILTSYLVSAQWWRAGGNAPELVAGLCDCATVLLLYLFGRRMWELALAVLFVFSMSINFLYLAHNLAGLEVVSQNAYGTVLEIINLLALALIGGVASFARLGRTDGWAFGPWLTLFGLVRPFVGQVPATEGREDR